MTEQVKQEKRLITTSLDTPQEIVGDAHRIQDTLTADRTRLHLAVVSEGNLLVPDKKARIYEESSSLSCPQLSKD